MLQAHKKIPRVIGTKTNFEENIRDVFARLLYQSNYVSFLQSKNIEVKHQQNTGHLTNDELMSINVISYSCI